MTRPVDSVRWGLGIIVGVALSSCASELDPNAPPWQPIDTTNVSPHWGHVAVYDARRDRMLVFGGENGSGQLAELWSLDLATLHWSLLPTTNTPYPRTDMAGFLDAARDRFVIVGGRVGLAQSIDDVEALDLQTSVWSVLPKGPSSRHDIAATTDGVHAWIFGGAGAFLQSLDDFWQLDLATDTWMQITAPGDWPSARTSYAIAFFDGGVYLVGGHDVSSVQRSVWRFDLSRQRWTQLNPSGAPVAWAHFGQALDSSCGSLYLSGGDNLDNLDTSLTERLALASPSFQLLPTSSLPPPRDHPSMILDARRRRLVLFGGGTLGDGLGTLNDAWMYQLGPCT